MKRALIFSASFLLTTWAAPAVAQNSILTGKYGFTGTAICNQASGNVTTFTTEGIHTFNGDGTGSVAETTLAVAAGFVGSTDINNHTYTFKYTVNHDRTFTVITDPGSFNGTFVSGPDAGLTVSIDQLAPIKGFIGIFAQTLTGTTLETPLETNTIMNGSVVQRVVQRRCQRSQIFIKVGDE
jgi:hypothetical protein